jgi:hypothetical protein
MPLFDNTVSNRTSNRDLCTQDKTSQQIPIYDPKPSIHDCKDAEGRAMQEQLPMDELRELQGSIYAISDRKLVFVI